MADIVNGGIIVLVAAISLAAVVGGIDQIRGDAEPPASLVGADADRETGPEPSDVADVRASGARLGDDRDDDRRGEGDRDRRAGEDRHGDEDDEDEEEEREEEKKKEKDEKDEDDEDDGD